MNKSAYKCGFKKNRRHEKMCHTLDDDKTISFVSICQTRMKNEWTNNLIIKMYYKFDYFIFFSAQSETVDGASVCLCLCVCNRLAVREKKGIDFGLVFQEISFVAFYFVATHRIGLPCITSKPNKTFLLRFR